MTEALKRKHRQFSEAKRRLRRLFLGKTCLIMVAAVLMISSAGLSGCGRTEEPEDGRMKVVTTIFPPYDFARAVSGGLADVMMLLSPGEEVHSYEPTPLDIKRIQGSDLFIYVGGENDVWVDRILDNMGEERPRTLRMVELTNTVA